MHMHTHTYIVCYAVAGTLCGADSISLKTSGTTVVSNAAPAMANSA